MALILLVDEAKDEHWHYCVNDVKYPHDFSTSRHQTSSGMESGRGLQIFCQKWKPLTLMRHKTRGGKDPRFYIFVGLVWE